MRYEENEDELWGKIWFVRQSVTNDFAKSKKIQAKLDKTRKLWYLLLHKFLPLLSKINFWSRDLTLPCVSTQFWDFLSLSLSCSATRKVTRTHKFCQDGFQLLFYLTGKQTKWERYYVTNYKFNLLISIAATSV